MLKKKFWSQVKKYLSKNQILSNSSMNSKKSICLMKEVRFSLRVKGSNLLSKSKIFQELMKIVRKLNWSSWVLRIGIELIRLKMKYLLLWQNPLRCSLIRILKNRRNLFRKKFWIDSTNWVKSWCRKWNQVLKTNLKQSKRSLKR